MIFSRRSLSAAAKQANGKVAVVTRVAVKEPGGRKITVSAPRPGPTRTKLFMESKTPEVLHHFEQEIALGRLGEPEDAAEAVSFLVSPGGGWTWWSTTPAS